MIRPYHAPDGVWHTLCRASGLHPVHPSFGTLRTHHHRGKAPSAIQYTTVHKVSEVSTIPRLCTPVHPSFGTIWTPLPSPLCTAPARLLASCTLLWNDLDSWPTSCTHALCVHTEPAPCADILCTPSFGKQNIWYDQRLCMCTLQIVPKGAACVFVSRSPLPDVYRASRAPAVPHCAPLLLQ